MLIPIQMSEFGLVLTIVNIWLLEVMPGLNVSQATASVWDMFSPLLNY